jgi:prepilin-type N-terminal cleavage/methylation domain-containing protein
MKTRPGRPGFTLIELLIGSAIMLVVVLGALAIFSGSNRISSDQQQYLELQHDVRAAMFYLTRDIRMAGSGLPQSFWSRALEGVDNESTGAAETPDRLRLMGNLEDPLVLRVSNYSGSSSQVTLEDYSFERNGYPDAYYMGKIILILPNPSSGCLGGAIRQITSVHHNNPGTNESFSFAQHGRSHLNPPRGLNDICEDNDYFDGGSVLFLDTREYWLDVTGSAAGLTAGVDGYIGGGIGGVLYMTLNGIQYPLAQSIETLQFQYNGDFDGDADGRLDGWQNWNAAWTDEQVSHVREVRIQILGRTRNVFASVGKTPSPDVHLYRRPAVANTAAAAADDWHKRFLLESSSAVRNLAMGLYNSGAR